MNNFFVGKIVFGALAFFCVLGMTTTVRDWIKGESIYSRTGSFVFRQITRAHNPQLFNLYCFAVFALSAFFFLVFLGVIIFVNPHTPTIE